MWKVVHFLNDNSVEPVPSYWVNRENNRCAWPNNNHLAKKMRDSRVKPNSFDFTNYKCKVLSQNICKCTYLLLVSIPTIIVIIIIKYLYIIVFVFTVYIYIYTIAYRL